MELDKLNHIFLMQIEEDTEGLLRYMLQDGDNAPSFCKHPINEITSLANVLTEYTYTGTQSGIPRFQKI